MEQVLPGEIVLSRKVARPNCATDFKPRQIDVYSNHYTFKLGTDIDFPLATGNVHSHWPSPFSHGHFWVTVLVIVLVVACYTEAIRALRGQDYMRSTGLSYNGLIAWYEFGVFLLYALTKTYSSVTSSELFIERYIKPDFLAFVLWLGGLVMFVLTLKNGFLRLQFKVFAGNLITLVLMCSQLVLLLSNLHYGMVWFLLSTLLVICNDIFAYVFGKLFGRHPLIALSPKKTWEGSRHVCELACARGL